jgi:lipooligosaccharide transport system permease protein
MNNSVIKIHSAPPSRVNRLFSVWYRHFRVYTRSFLSNGLPPFVEPLFFLAGIGLGLGKFVGLINGVSYIEFLAAGIIIPSAMYTAAFECTFGTFIRLDFDKVYDGMLASSIDAYDLLLGEILFAATKSFFFSAASYMSLFAPLIGFFTGLMFASFSLFVTSFVTNINHFNFYFTGLLTPMFFFSGIVFPLSSLPKALIPVAYTLPLTHSADLVRAFCFNNLSLSLLWNVLYIVVFIVFFTYVAVRRLKKRLIQ